MSIDETIISVRRHWNDWRIGQVPFKKLCGIEWDRLSGGVGITSPHLMVYAYIWCNDLVAGEIAHS